MIEAIPVLFVAAVAVVAYAGARLYVANPANYDGKAELPRMESQSAWLQARLQIARREQWDPEMVTRLTEDLRNLEAHLAKLKGASPQNGEASHRRS